LSFFLSKSSCFCLFLCFNLLLSHLFINGFSRSNNFWELEHIAEWSIRSFKFFDTCFCFLDNSLSFLTFNTSCSGSSWLDKTCCCCSRIINWLLD
jgi:hypothetical protein